MIRVRGVSRSFGALQALAGVDFAADDGAVTALLGPNGAGKSTLLRIITGLQQADEGKVDVDGLDPAADALAVRARMGVLLEPRGLHPRLTAMEHLQLSARLHGLAEGEIAARAVDVARRLGMEPLLRRRVAGFSQGERMKVALGRALIHEPQNVLLDEPQNGLDVDSVRALRRAMDELRDLGRMVLLASHQLVEVAAVADRVVMLVRGRSIGSATPQQWLERTQTATLEDAFVAAVAEVDRDPQVAR